MKLLVSQNYRETEKTMSHSTVRREPSWEWHTLAWPHHVQHTLRSLFINASLPLFTFYCLGKVTAKMRISNNIHPEPTLGSYLLNWSRPNPVGERIAYIYSNCNINITLLENKKS